MRLLSWLLRRWRALLRWLDGPPPTWLGGEIPREAVERWERRQPLDRVLDSPNFVPQQLRDFAARGYKRINRGYPEGDAQPRVRRGA